MHFTHFVKISSPLTLTAFCLFSSLCAAQQDETLTITGVWLTEDGEAKIEIIETYDGIYEGTVVWTKAQSQKARKSIGIKVVRDFEKSGKNKYQGKIYHPDNGEMYNGSIRILSHGEIKVRAYMSFSLFGKSQDWTRVKG